MRGLAVPAVIILFVLTSCALSTESDASETVPDGSVYEYITRGSAHPDYYCEISSVRSDADVLYVPAVLEGYDVRILKENSFSGCPMSSVIIPAGVAEIEDGAFAGCGNLRDVYLLGGLPDRGLPADARIHRMPDVPDDENSIRVETISGISYAKMPDGWMVLGGKSSGGNLIISDTVLGERVASVGPYAFAGKMTESGKVDRNTDVVSVTIPEGIGSIRERAFYYCDVVSINFPESLKHIHDEAFRAAEKLGKADFGGGLEFIGFEAFRECDSLVSLDIPDSVTSAGIGCIKWCESLKTAAIGKGLKEIPSGMFFYCTALESISVPDTVSKIGPQAFYNCRSLDNVKMPGSVSVLGQESFRMCESLSSADLGNVSEIQRSAFRDCAGMEKLDLPGSVKILGQYCFADCVNLKRINASGPAPEGDKTVFLNDPATVFVSKEYSGSWSGSAFGLDVAKENGNGFLMIIAAAAAVLAIVAAALIFFRKNNAGRR